MARLTKLVSLCLTRLAIRNCSACTCKRQEGRAQNLTWAGRLACVAQQSARKAQMALTDPGVCLRLEWKQLPVQQVQGKKLAMLCAASHRLAEGVARKLEIDSKVDCPRSTQPNSPEAHKQAVTTQVDLLSRWELLASCAAAAAAAGTWNS